MRTKISVTGLEARDKVIKGANYLADAVKSTLGPFGTNALLEKSNKITNDGYTISSELASTLEDEVERRGALALHEACAKTNDEVGDSTTSVQVLAQAIIKESVRLLPNDKTISAKKKPSEVVQMIEKSRLNVIEKLKEKVKPVESEQELISSARVSVEDENLAELIGSTQWKIGKDGFITVDEVLDTHTSVEIVKGIRIDNGFGTPYMVTNPTEQSFEAHDVSVLLTNYTMDAKDLIALKDKIFDALKAQKKLNLVIIARAFTSDAIKACMESLKTVFHIFPINAPYTYQSEIMKDIAVITGGTYYDTEERNLEDINIQDIGFASKIMARRWDAIITGPDDDTKVLANDAIQKRITELNKRLEGNISDFERKGIQERIAQFNGGFAMLKVGAETSFERKFKKDKADDAVNSVRLALQGGTVAGAGQAFKEIADTLDDDDILKRPLQSIYNQIITTAPEGYEIPEWCRDPYLTLVSALTNACSVAAQFGSIGCVVTTKDKKEKCDHVEEE